MLTPFWLGFNACQHLARLRQPERPNNMVLTNQIAFPLQSGQMLLHIASAPDASRLPPVFCDGVLAEAEGDLPLPTRCATRYNL